MQQFATFEVCFVNLQIRFDGMWSHEGQMNTPVVPSSHPGNALRSSVVRDGTPHENVEKAFTAQHWQLYCQKTPVSIIASFY